MSEALPARANLDYLKKLCKERVKDLRAAGNPATLAYVQRAFAKQYGFKSWSALRTHVQNRLPLASKDVAAVVPASGPPALNAESILDALVWPSSLGPWDTEKACELFEKHPDIGTHSIHAAAAVGSVAGVRQWLAKDAALARQAGGLRGWPPLLYLCFSRLLKVETSQKKTNTFAACAQVLLEAGADANSSFVNPGDQVRESALYGASGIANNPDVTRLLLKHGANVNDNETLYHTAEHLEHECLKLVLAKKPDLLDFCLCHKLDMEDAEGVRIFLEYGANPNYLIERGAMDIRGFRPLHFAILRGRGVPVIEALFAGGADPTLTSSHGITPWALAMRLGRKKVAAALARVAKEELPPEERFCAACSAGDEKAARKLLKTMPTIIQEISPINAALLPMAAGEGRYSAVKLMLDLDFPINAIGAWGGTALHQAAWPGHLAIVKLLLARGARVDLTQQWGGDALATAIHGMIHNNPPRGPEIIRMIAERMQPTDWQRHLEKAREQGAKDVVPVLEALIRSASDDPAIRALPEHRRTHKIAGWKPLMDAAYLGDAARVAKLLKQGADPNVVSTTPARLRPLHRAMEPKKTDPRGTRHEAAVRALLEGGADPRLRGGHEQLSALATSAIGDTRFVRLLQDRFEPLDIFHAALLGEEERVTELLRQDRALAKAKDLNGWTALHYAVSSAMFHDVRQKKRLLGIARHLIDAGANVAATYLWEETWPIPVLFGCCGRHDFPEMAELLIKAGASACDGESVYHAADEGHEGALAVIERHTPPEKLARECSFALVSVLHWGRTRGVKWFLEHGADPNTLSERYGNSALHEAAARGSAEKVISLLLKYGADPRLKNKKGATALEIAKAARHTRALKQLGGT